MTRVPALPSQEDAAEAQIEAAIARLVRLLAQHVARDLATNAPANEEQTDEDQAPLED